MIEIDFHIFGLAQPPNRWFYCLANECWFGLYASLICSHPMKPSSSHTALAGPSFSNRPPTLLGTAGRTARGPNRTLAHFVGPKMGQFSTLCPDDGSFHEVISHRILGYPIFPAPPWRLRNDPLGSISKSASGWLSNLTCCHQCQNKVNSGSEPDFGMVSVLRELIFWNKLNGLLASSCLRQSTLNQKGHKGSTQVIWAELA